MPRVGLLWRAEWDPAPPDGVVAERSRLHGVFAAFAALGVAAEPVVYADDRADAVRAQLLSLHGVLVWVNPIEQGPDRSVLDPLLREVAGAGVFVSARPDVILKIATKRVLVDTAQMSWSAETHRDVERRWRTNRKRARWARFRLATIRRTRERGRAGSAATLSRAGLS